jgi:dethiobiotin synthetase
MARLKRYLITGTAARVGKTTVGCALGFAMRARGLRVGVMKPVDTLEAQDAQALALAVGSIMPMELMCPYRYSSTPTPTDAPNLTHIAQCLDEISAQNDVVLVESASMIDFADLAATLNLEVILVIGNRPGCINAATLAIQRCESRGLKLAGSILCDCDPITETDDASMRKLFAASYLGRMRQREPLSRIIVEQLI